MKPGEIGEIVSRGDNLMLEYYNEPEQTAAFFKLGDGWGWSGDVGVIDADGFVTLVDRSKDMIISGGENVYPKEIENVLYEHRGGGRMRRVRHPRRQVGRGAGRLRAARRPAQRCRSRRSDRALRAACWRASSGRALVKFVDDFPKTPIGKIQKNVLREPYWKAREKKI